MSGQNTEMLGFVSSHPPKGRQENFPHLHDAFFFTGEMAVGEKEPKMLLSMIPKLLY